FWGIAKLLWSLFRGGRWADCPPISRLKDFLAERLPSNEGARVAAHLELCSACQHRIEGLTTGSPLSVCPPIGRLKEFLSDRLPWEERAWLVAHLELCSACQHRVEGLSTGHNSWPGMAHKLSERSPSPEPALRKVMAKLKEIDEGATGDEPVFAGDL